MDSSCNNKPPLLASLTHPVFDGPQREPHFDWMKLGIKLQQMGVSLDIPGVISWDTNGGNSVFMRGDYAGHSVNELACAYAKRFGLKVNIKTDYDHGRN